MSGTQELVHGTERGNRASFTSEKEKFKYRESLSMLQAMGLEPGTHETRDQSANHNAIQDGLSNSQSADQT